MPDIVVVIIIVTITLLNKGQFSAARWGPIVLAALGLSIAVGALILLLI